ncbi:MAG TPA: hypothetical protein VGL15_16740 [Vicinamibacteria bacterium]
MSANADGSGLRAERDSLPRGARGSKGARRSAPLLNETALVVLLALTELAWFGGVPRFLPPAIPAAGLLLVALARAARTRPRLRPPRIETVACLLLATAYRLPALLHPWGWVNRDGAYGAFVALHLLQGARPAPAFTEGASYQGTLKGHLAAALALVTRENDLSLLMVGASLVLYLVFLASTMALARRVAGVPAAVAAGLYLAIAPRFLTVFSLNCVGQYVDVLALGGLALALLARALDEGRWGSAARRDYFAIGWLLGAAFWQQPVALGYVGAAAIALALRRTTWRDAWVLVVPLGAAIGLLPALVWNAQHGWTSGGVLHRDLADLRAQADALPYLVQRTFYRSLPVLAGLSPGHPWAVGTGVVVLMASVIPLLLVAYIALRRRSLATAVRAGVPRADILAPLLLLATLALFWSVAAGKVYLRPRYLLPLTAATAVHLGAVAAWAWPRSRPAAAGLLAALLAVNAAGTLPRFAEGRAVADDWRRVVAALEDKRIRTGYADFSIAAPVTMFTSERIVLSPALGPTPAYESESQARRVHDEGPDAFVLRPEDDAAGFAALLRTLGVTFRMELQPIPVFYGFSRRVGVGEVAGAIAPAGAPPTEE